MDWVVPTTVRCTLDSRRSHERALGLGRRIASEPGPIVLQLKLAVIVLLYQRRPAHRVLFQLQLVIVIINVIQRRPARRVFLQLQVAIVIIVQHHVASDRIVFKERPVAVVVVRVVVLGRLSALVQARFGLGQPEGLALELPHALVVLRRQHKRLHLFARRARDLLLGHLACELFGRGEAALLLLLDLVILLTGDLGAVKDFRRHPHHVDVDAFHDPLARDLVRRVAARRAKLANLLLCELRRSLADLVLDVHLLLALGPSLVMELGIPVGALGGLLCLEAIVQRARALEQLDLLRR
mmetsp:Transcript_61532/g.183270  ORF Transcript_61532/g.183270 Transcript_61532/m.183270 type:complete len:297 (+) Transcript_61532:134-1024(+)